MMEDNQFLAFNWCMVAVTLITVLIRLYVRVYLHGPLLSKETYRWSEFFVVLGWLLFLAVAICDHISFKTGGRDLQGKSKEFEMSTDNKIVFLKAMFAWSWFYKPSIYMMKYALLFFYVELIQKVQHRKMWIAVIVTAVLNTAGLASQILFMIFQCMPIRHHWSLDPNEAKCTDSTAYPAVTWSFHVLTDILVFALPFALLKSTLINPGKHSGGELTNAVVMFGLGIINVLSAIVVMALRLLPENYSDTPQTILGQVTTILYTIQIATAIAIPCCPQIRIAFKHLTGQYDKEKKARVVTNTYLSHRSRAASISHERSGTQSVSHGWRSDPSVALHGGWKSEASAISAVALTRYDSNGELKEEVSHESRGSSSNAGDNQC